ncbi:MAG TPA: hypothetical protein VJQ56_06925 [Blastocatellia bacterium]|nr:hypothetical protein [Blastocatellia bacterium]
MKRFIRLAMLAMAVSLVSVPTVFLAEPRPQDEPDPAAKGIDIYCTGFISEVPVARDFQIVGGEREYTRMNYVQGDVVYLNKGRESGVHSGAVYTVIRPLGEVVHPFNKKKMGTLVRELGLIRVLEVQAETATAEVIVSCDTMTFGDALRPYETPTAPVAKEAGPLPRYAEGSGGTTGQIFLSRGYREYIAANQVVFIDLGSRQGIKPGDSFTIFRKINNRESIVTPPRDNVIVQRSEGFQSDHYRGGELSVGATAEHESRVHKNRPELPRKVLGELVVLKVEKTSSVALVTRTNAEVNIGDFVERTF